MGAVGMDRTRLTLDLSGKLNDELDRLAKKTGRSKSDLLRLGVDYLLRADKAVEEGMTVGAWKEDEQKRVRQEREFVGLAG
jgi:predicted transcriptional regulator